MFILQSEGHLCKTTPVNVVVVFLDQFLFFFVFFYLILLFVLIWVFFFFLHSDRFLYLIKPVTFYQVLHFNSNVV